jgi:CheY-like chemotaxis protein
MNQQSTIILADDDVAVRSALARLLQVSGYRVLEAENGHGVLVHLAQEPTALVITDMLMPEMEGAETIRLIRDSYPEVKIIAISGGGLNPPTDYLNLARTLGADATFAKPTPSGELLAAIAKLVPRS